MNNKAGFAVFFFLAFVVSYIPFVKLPFMWAQTFFHEISHGLTAIATGGSINRLEIHLRGSGVCYTHGGSNFLISFAGYAGAALWGSLLVLTVVRAGSRRAHIVAALLGALVIFSGVFWVRDVISWLIIAVIAAMCLVAYRYGASKPVALFMQFLGTYVILDAIKSPLYMIDGRSLGDGAVLSNLTLVPEIGWVGVWEAFAILCVWMLWRALAGSNEQSSTNY